MTTVGKFLLAGGIALLGYETFRYMSAKELSFSFAGLTTSQSGLTTTIAISVQIINPTQWTNTIDQLYGDVYTATSKTGQEYNWQFLGNASLNGPVNIPATENGKLGSVTVPIAVAVPDLSLLAIILKIITGGFNAAAVRFVGRGRVNALPVSIPLDIIYQIV